MFYIIKLIPHRSVHLVTQENLKVNMWQRCRTSTLMSTKTKYYVW